MAFIKKLNVFLKKTFAYNCYVICFANPGYLNFIVYILYLRYKKHGVPFRQTASFDSLLKFINFLNNRQIIYFLGHGNLLGAVRQGAFAGKPGDVELYVKSSYYDQFVSYEQDLNALGYKFKYHLSSKIDLFPPRGCKITLLFLSPKSTQDGYVYLRIKNGEELDVIHEDHLESPETGYLFGFPFNIPKNPEKIIEERYGPNWKVPDAPQYAWFK
ncbi:hypothetical protein [Desulfonatronovibrio hydrogenovorans]|uniref:hypothetical protein n=1 Tax=Desulfonatronovibrio hydrogenovorans TaxID=53245 RepID=UPI00123787A0|nr:hypothetical protein [Desulfonatronovibrio hydrogenovorans]